MKLGRISLIEPKTSFPSIWSIVKQPRIGSVILATILKNKGYEAKVFSETISPIDWEYVFSSDICGISYMTPTALESYEISKKIQKRKIPIVHGGPHATILPEEALKCCDVVVRGEGDITFPTLIEALLNKSSIKKIKGISFKEKGKIINNPPQKCVDLDTLPSPDLSLIHNYTKSPWFDFRIRTGVVSTSRGCPYNCKFCSVIKLFGRNYRQRSVKNIIKDIKAHLKVRIPSSIFFVDDNFIVDREKTKRLLKEIIKNKFPTSFNTQIRISSANDEELIKLMKKAGLTLVFVGFESINQKTLDEYNKNLKVEDTIKGIKMLKKYGIDIHGMFVFGADNDTPEIVEKTLNFCLKYGIDTIQFFPVTPMPGTEFTKILAREKRLINVPWNLIDMQHVNFFPKQIKPSVLQKEIFKAYKKFYSFKRAFKELLKGNLYSFGCAFFGKLFILNKEIKSFEEYIKFLEKEEKGKYEGNKLIKLKTKL